MEEYKSNSDISKQNSPQEKPKVTKIISGTATTKKKGTVAKLSEVFISSDVKDVKSYLFSDVFVPNVKKIVYELITAGAAMTLFGVGSAIVDKNKKNGQILYGSMFKENSIFGKPAAARSMSVFDYDNIILDDKGQAEELLMGLDDIISQYGVASVGDLYDLAGISRPGQNTDSKYGWRTLKNATTVRLMDGRYTLNLPKAVPIE